MDTEHVVNIIGKEETLVKRHFQLLLVTQCRKHLENASGVFNLVNLSVVVFHLVILVIEC